MQNSFYKRECAAAGDGCNLNIHSWLSNKPKAFIYYFHGIQSHGGWLFELGNTLASFDIDLHCLDRRGSGTTRNQLDTKEQLINDYNESLASIRSRYRNDIPLYILGQSLGGSIATAFVSETEVDCNALIYCAAALGQHRVKQTKESRSKIRSLCDEELSTLNLEDKQYTSLPKYLEFMSNDSLMLRSIPNKSRRIFLEIEDSYIHKPGLLDNYDVYYAHPRSDEIINIKQSKSTLNTLTNNKVIYKEFDTKDHYIEFSSKRNEYINWLVDTVNKKI